ncbi:MAG TPA: hypothetical protein ENN43_03210 [bacterium]|nr:hypothetical protein [bacterium]
MKKILILAAAALLVLSACKELQRANPLDPESPDYTGIKYEGEVSYPADTTIKVMRWNSGSLYLGAYNSAYSNCVVKMAPGVAPQFFNDPQPAAAEFGGILDMCDDAAGNIYITDGSENIYTLSPGGVITSFGHNTNSGEGLFIEWSGNELYISSVYDKTINRYSENGIPVDSQVLSFTANGSFTPGKLFKAGSGIFVINLENPSEMVKLEAGLSPGDIYTMPVFITDSAVYSADKTQLLSAYAVYRVDTEINTLFKWGYYGQGEGRVFNGRSIVYDSVGKKTYVLDGHVIKIFGE